MDSDNSLNYSHYTSNDNSNTINYNSNSNDATNFEDNSQDLLLGHSLTSTDGYRTTTSQLFIAPSSLHLTQRLLTNSSTDSSSLQAWRRRLRSNSSPRLSNFDDNTNNVTLLTFARAVQTVGKKVGSGIRKTTGTLFVTRPKKRQFVRDSDILEQTKWICVDSVVSRLASRQLMGLKVGLTAPNWRKSVHVINATASLESAHPGTYHNVSKKLRMTMNSRKIIRNTLALLLIVLFDQDITWGRIVSMFSLAGLFAEECVKQGHEDFIKDVVDVVVAFTDARLLGWLLSQGGWDAFPVPGGSEHGRLSKLRLLLLICFTFVVSLTCYVFLGRVVVAMRGG